MEAKEKAKELFRKIKYSITTLKTNAEVKQCALICVEEIQKTTVYDKNYWQEVKTEIEKL